MRRRSRTTSRPGSERGVRKPPRRPGRPRAAVLAVWVAAAAIAAIATWIARRGPAPPPSTARGTANVALPLDSLLALAARVQAMQQAGRYTASLPGTRVLMRQHELRGRLVAAMYTDYARILNNAAFEIDDEASRSSVERVALEREALGATERALEMARTQRERAEALAVAGRVHEVWGFPYDAFVEYRAALAADPTEAAAAAVAARVRETAGPSGGASLAKRTGVAADSLDPAASERYEALWRRLHPGGGGRPAR